MRATVIKAICFCLLCTMFFPLLSFFASQNGINAQKMPGSAFEALAEEPDGEKLCALYGEFDAFAQSLLTTGRDLDMGTAYTPQGIVEKHYEVTEGTFSGKKYGLSVEKVESVYMAYRSDHPEMFFLPSVFLVDTTENGIRLLMESAYFSGKTRQGIVSRVKEKARSVVSTIPALTDYEKALFLHDYLARDLYYRCESDGVTPSMKASAHSIIGWLDGSGVVCDGYAKTYQYLLQTSGIECMTVSGTSKGNPHAWNIVRAENGWFWADLTFDDRPETSLGVMHAYFASPDAAFRRDHTPFTQAHGISYQCALPETSAAVLTYYDYKGEMHTRLPDLNALARNALIGGDYTLEVAVPTQGASDTVSALYARTYFNSSVKTLYEAYSFKAVNCGDYTVLSIGFTSRRFDLDGDGYVTLDDAQLLTDHICGVCVLDFEVHRAADANGNGRFDIGDVCLLLEELP